jgi:hypothetical protein
LGARSRARREPAERKARNHGPAWSWDQGKAQHWKPPSARGAREYHADAAHADARTRAPRV